MARVAFIAVCVLTLLSSAILTPAGADNWPQFRGPDGSGKSAATGLPVTFGEDENVTWKTPIHGRAWSSPVVWDNQIWMNTATEDGKRMSAVCVDFETGKIIHDILVFENEKPYFCHPTNTYASGTPVIEEGRVYAHFGRYGTAAIDTASGKILWTRRDLDANHFRGPGSSPVIHGDVLLVALDGIDVQYVVGLDKHTGKTVWKKDRSTEYGTDNGDRKKAYSTGGVLQLSSGPQFISPGAVATIAYEPDTGDELWKVYHGGMNAAAPPVFGNGLVYLSAGSGPTALIAVRPGGNGDVTDSHIAWTYGQSVPKRSSVIIDDDLLYMVSDNGIATCLDARTGEEVWQKRIGGTHWASPVLADGRLYCFTKEGKAPVLAAGREFKLLAENELDAGCNASPAVVGKSLLVRTETHLYRFEK